MAEEDYVEFFDVFGYKEKIRKTGIDSRKNT